MKDHEKYSESEWEKWVLDAIQKVRAQKQRPSLERITNAIRQHHSNLGESVIYDHIELLVEKGLVLKVFNKGQVSYRDPGGVQNRQVVVNHDSDLNKLAVKAVRELGDCDGSGLKEIEEYITHSHRLNVVTGVDLTQVIKNGLKRAVERGLLINENKVYKVSDKLDSSLCAYKSPKPGRKKKSEDSPKKSGLPICSECLGTAANNKSGLEEELSCCCECGASVHPSCVPKGDFLLSILARGNSWYCQECTTCAKCHNHDDQVCIVKCGSCDRGHHLQCLDPPFDKKALRGTWKCISCIEGKPPSPQSSPHPFSPNKFRQKNLRVAHLRNLRKAARASLVGKKGKLMLEDPVERTCDDGNVCPCPEDLLRGGGRSDEISHSISKEKQKFFRGSAFYKKQWRSVCREKSVVTPVIPLTLFPKSVPPLPSESSAKELPFSALALDTQPWGFAALSRPPPSKRKHTALEPQPSPSSLVKSAVYSKRHEVERRLLLSGNQPSATTVATTAAPAAATINSLMSSELPPGVTQKDVEVFKQAREKAIALTKTNNSVGDDPLTAGGQPRCPAAIEFGKYLIQTWYSSPFPQEYARLGKLFLCEFCLKYTKSKAILERHLDKCSWRHPPGTEIYRHRDLSVFEVDGNVAKFYCQNLCLLAKLFLDHKTLYYDVEPFLFYVLTKVDDKGFHLVGYFSKEKHCQQKYNVSCIMTLPQYQRQGFGRFLIDFSYLLSKEEGQAGTPEKPLSDLGRVSYHAYWKSVILEYLHYHRDGNFSISSISKLTGLNPQDIALTLQNMGMVEPWKREDCGLAIVVDWNQVDAHMERVSKSTARIPIEPECLRWTPLISNLANPFKSPEESSQEEDDEYEENDKKINETVKVEVVETPVDKEPTIKNGKVRNKSLMSPPIKENAQKDGPPKLKAETPLNHKSKADSLVPSSKRRSRQRLLTELFSNEKQHNKADEQPPTLQLPSGIEDTKETPTREKRKRRKKGGDLVEEKTVKEEKPAQEPAAIEEEEPVLKKRRGRRSLLATPILKPSRLKVPPLKSASEKHVEPSPAPSAELPAGNTPAPVGRRSTRPRSIKRPLSPSDADTPAVSATSKPSNSVSAPSLPAEEEENPPLSKAAKLSLAAKERWVTRKLKEKIVPLQKRKGRKRKKFTLVKKTKVQQPTEDPIRKVFGRKRRLKLVEKETAPIKDLKLGSSKEGEPRTSRKEKVPREVPLRRAILSQKEAAPSRRESLSRKETALLKEKALQKESSLPKESSISNEEVAENDVSSNEAESVPSPASGKASKPSVLKRKKRGWASKTPSKVQSSDNPPPKVMKKKIRPWGVKPKRGKGGRRMKIQTTPPPVSEEVEEIEQTEQEDKKEDNTVLENESKLQSDETDLKVAVVNEKDEKLDSTDVPTSTSSNPPSPLSLPPPLEAEVTRSAELEDKEEIIEEAKESKEAVDKTENSDAEDKPKENQPESSSPSSDQDIKSEQSPEHKEQDVVAIPSSPEEKEPEEAKKEPIVPKGKEVEVEYRGEVGSMKEEMSPPQLTPVEDISPIGQGKDFKGKVETPKEQSLVPLHVDLTLGEDSMSPATSPVEQKIPLLVEALEEKKAAIKPALKSPQVKEIPPLLEKKPEMTEIVILDEEKSSSPSRPEVATENESKSSIPPLNNTDTPSLGVYTPDSTTNSVHSIHAFSGNGSQCEVDVGQLGLESPASISSTEMPPSEPPVRAPSAPMVASPPVSHPQIIPVPVPSHYECPPKPPAPVPTHPYHHHHHHAVHPQQYIHHHQPPQPTPPPQTQQLPPQPTPPPQIQPQQAVVPPPSKPSGNSSRGSSSKQHPMNPQGQSPVQMPQRNRSTPPVIPHQQQATARHLHQSAASSPGPPHYPPPPPHQSNYMVSQSGSYVSVLQHRMTQPSPSCSVPSGPKYYLPTQGATPSSLQQLQQLANGLDSLPPSHCGTMTPPPPPVDLTPSHTTPPPPNLSSYHKFYPNSSSSRSSRTHHAQSPSPGPRQVLNPNLMGQYGTPFNGYRVSTQQSPSVTSYITNAPTFQAGQIPMQMVQGQYSHEHAQQNVYPYGYLNGSLMQPLNSTMRR